jgi:hypothetical protein
LRARLDAQNEWLLIRASGKSFALRNAEIELESSGDKLLFGFLDDNGFQTWRISDCVFIAGEIQLRLSRNFAEKRKQSGSSRELQRRSLSENLNSRGLKKPTNSGDYQRKLCATKLVSVKLNEENGRFAHIIFSDSARTGKSRL